MDVYDLFTFGFRELLDGGMSVAQAERMAVTRTVKELGIEEATVPGDFPLALADLFRGRGIKLSTNDSIVELRRRVKSRSELRGIRSAQRAAEAAMALAGDLLGRAQPTADGHLALGGEPLTADYVRSLIRTTCSEHGAWCPSEVIVASVWNGFGHEPGSGPLPVGLPIVIDVWARDDESACWADMTRTFVVGTPALEYAGMIDAHERLVRFALEQTKAAIRPGVSGRQLFDRVCDLFEVAGHLTQRTTGDEDEIEGFQFSLGHGIGLEVHEPPSLGLAGRDPLVPGDVLAIEPGLWDPRIGEIRFEDIVLVTEAGCETLTRFPYDLIPGSSSP
jgi:Xaa-Pro aminopeptidase